MKLRLFVSLPLVALLLSACGGEKGPIGPNPFPTPPVGGSIGASSLMFMDGGAGTATPGVSVAIAGRSSQITDSNGQVAVEPPVATGTMFDASLDGRFLPRNTLIRSLTDPVTLWPVSPSYPAEFFQELVHNQFMPGRRLSRPVSGITFLVPAPEVLAPEVREIQLAAEVNTAATDGQVRYVVSTQAPPGARMYTVQYAPGQANPCQAGPNMQGNVVGGGSISCRDPEQLQRYIAHEVGHTLGLGHDNATLRGLMFSLTTLKDFTPAEKLAIKMMFQRYPGTQWPDNDRNAQVLNNQRTTIVIACGEPQ